MGIKNTLSVYFLKWIISICFVGLLILLSNIMFVNWGISQQLFLPANAPIDIAEKIKNEIVEKNTIDPDILPSELDYAIFQKKTGTLLKSNLSTRNIKKAEEAFLNNSKDKSSSFIRYDSRNEVILIHYNLKIQFKNPELRKIFPNPGISLAILSSLIYFIYLIINIRKFSYLIIQENQKLIKVTNKIKERDLNFEFPQVRFNEYKDVMEAMESLSEALVKSIQKEIQATNSKTEQINYLVHDIKIPLTVIKGNVELLETMIVNEDIQESFNDILNSIKQIERYIQDVIDINLNNKKIDMIKDELFIVDFLKSLEIEVKSLGANVLIEDYTEKGTKVLIDIRLFIRAINNIVLNGIERTPKDENVKITITQNQDSIQFIITDQGPGFSEVSLQKATELFYTENDGRTNNSHYGLGLTFTEKVIKQLNGSLTLRNTAMNSGEVIVELPILKKG
ncbi:Sensor protein CreC [Lysinibacillus sphaericus]|uniref:histidine kinase n=1 Tax=Lysinibacillus sphaericus TaxID=1421 RepID=A0A2S5CWE5_LYSSH|nr:sensor histidine kinase [Lysinibacillus sphaericus]POZ55067.1 Sensor protein CreC [Lysinibacillus sphaericus]